MSLSGHMDSLETFDSTDAKLRCSGRREYYRHALDSQALPCPDTSDGFPFRLSLFASKEHNRAGELVSLTEENEVECNSRR